MIKFIVVMMILVSMILFIGYLFFKDNRKCLEGHEEKYRTVAYHTYIQVGAVMVPTYHPARIATRFVCDRYEEK